MAVSDKISRHYNQGLAGSVPAAPRRSMAAYPRESPQLGEHNRPLRVGATHREATKPSEAECRGVSPATKEALIFLLSGRDARSPSYALSQLCALPVMRSPSRAVATGESDMDPMADSYGGMCNFPLRVSHT